MITDIKPQTLQEFEDNQWIWKEPIKQFDRLTIVDVDYTPSEDAFIEHPWEKGHLTWMPF